MANIEVGRIRLGFSLGSQSRDHVGRGLSALLRLCREPTLDSSSNMELTSSQCPTEKQQQLKERVVDLAPSIVVSRVIGCLLASSHCC